MIDLVKECEGATLIGITGHTNPDGDCVGSTLALWQFLKKVCPDKKVQVILEQPAPIFDFIEGASDIISETDSLEGSVYDVMFVLDSIIERCGVAVPFIKEAKKVVNIDHHVSNTGEGDVNELNPSASSTAELIYELIVANNKKYMDKEMAQTLYIGIIHDSGVMQYSNTSPRTLRIVADLVEYGFDFPKLIDETFYEKTYVQSQIMGRAILEAFLLMDGKVMVSMIDQKTMKFYGADKKDLSGIVNQLRIVKGVEVAIFLYETDTQEYKVSLRSCTDKVDVAAVSSYFGGGGHVRAAGCTMYGSYYDVINNLTAQLSLQIM